MSSSLFHKPTDRRALRCQSDKQPNMQPYDLWMFLYTYRARLARSNKEWSCELLYGNQLRATHLGFASARPLGSLPASHASAATLQLASDRPQGSAPRPVRPRIHSDDAISARSVSKSVWSNVSDQVRFRWKRASQALTLTFNTFFGAGLGSNDGQHSSC